MQTQMQFTTVRQNDFQWCNLYRRRYGVCTYAPPLPRNRSTTTSSFPKRRDVAAELGDVDVDERMSIDVLHDLYEHGHMHRTHHRRRRPRHARDTTPSLSTPPSSSSSANVSPASSSLMTTTTTPTRSRSGDAGSVCTRDDDDEDDDETSYFASLFATTTASSSSSSGPNNNDNDDDDMRDRRQRRHDADGEGAVCSSDDSDDNSDDDESDDSCSRSRSPTLPSIFRFLHGKPGSHPPHYNNDNDDKSSKHSAARSHAHAVTRASYLAPGDTSSSWLQRYAPHNDNDNDSVYAHGQASYDCDDHADVRYNPHRLPRAICDVHRDAWLLLMDRRLLAWLGRDAREKGCVARRLRQCLLDVLQGPASSYVTAAATTLHNNHNNNNNHNNSHTMTATPRVMGDAEALQCVLDTFTPFFAVVCAPRLIQRARKQFALSKRMQAAGLHDAAAADVVGMRLFSQYATWREAYRHRTQWPRAPCAYFLIHDASYNFAQVSALYVLLDVLRRGHHVHTTRCLASVRQPVQLERAGEQLTQAHALRRVAEQQRHLCPYFAMQQLTEDVLLAFEQSTSQSTLDMVLRVTAFLTDCALDAATASRFLGREALQRHGNFVLPGVQTSSTTTTATTATVTTSTQRDSNDSNDNGDDAATARATAAVRLSTSATHDDDGGTSTAPQPQAQQQSQAAAASSSTMCTSRSVDVDGDNKKDNDNDDDDTDGATDVAMSFSRFALMHTFADTDFHALFELVYWFTDAATANARVPVDAALLPDTARPTLHPEQPPLTLWSLSSTSSSSTAMLRRHMATTTTNVAAAAVGAGGMSTLQHSPSLSQLSLCTSPSGSITSQPMSLARVAPQSSLPHQQQQPQQLPRTQTPLTLSYSSTAAAAAGSSSSPRGGVGKAARGVSAQRSPARSSSSHKTTSRTAATTHVTQPQAQQQQQQQQQHRYLPGKTQQYRPVGSLAEALTLYELRRSTDAPPPPPRKSHTSTTTTESSSGGGNKPPARATREGSDDVATATTTTLPSSSPATRSGNKAAAAARSRRRDRSTDVAAAQQRTSLQQQQQQQQQEGAAVATGKDDAAEARRRRVALPASTSLLAVPLLFVTSYVQLHGAQWLKHLLQRLFHILRKESVLLYVNRLDLDSAYAAFVRDAAECHVGNHHQHHNNYNNYGGSSSSTTSIVDVSKSALASRRRLAAAADTATSTTTATASVGGGGVAPRGSALSEANKEQFLARMEQLESLICQDILYVFNEFFSSLHGHRSATRLPQGITALLTQFVTSVHLHLLTRVAPSVELDDVDDAGGVTAATAQRGSRGVVADDDDDDDGAGAAAAARRVRVYVQRLKQSRMVSKALRSEHVSQRSMGRLLTNIEQQRLVKFVLFDCWMLPALNNAIAMGYLPESASMHLRWNVDAFARYLKILLHGPFVEHDRDVVSGYDSCVPSRRNTMTATAVTLPTPTTTLQQQQQQQQRRHGSAANTTGGSGVVISLPSVPVAAGATTAAATAATTTTTTWRGGKDGAAASRHLTLTLPPFITGIYDVSSGCLVCVYAAPSAAAAAAVVALTPGVTPAASPLAGALTAVSSGLTSGAVAAATRGGGGGGSNTNNNNNNSSPLRATAALTSTLPRRRVPLLPSLLGTTPAAPLRASDAAGVVSASALFGLTATPQAHTATTTTTAQAPPSPPLRRPSPAMTAAAATATAAATMTTTSQRPAYYRVVDDATWDELSSSLRSLNEALGLFSYDLDEEMLLLPSSASSPQQQQSPPPPPSHTRPHVLQPPPPSSSPSSRTPSVIASPLQPLVSTLSTSSSSSTTMATTASSFLWSPGQQTPPASSSTAAAMASGQHATTARLLAMPAYAHASATTNTTTMTTTTLRHGMAMADGGGHCAMRMLNSFCRRASSESASNVVVSEFDVLPSIAANSVDRVYAMMTGTHALVEEALAANALPGLHKGSRAYLACLAGVLLHPSTATTALGNVYGNSRTLYDTLLRPVEDKSVLQMLRALAAGGGGGGGGGGVAGMPLVDTNALVPLLASSCDDADATTTTTVTTTMTHGAGAVASLQRRWRADAAKLRQQQQFLTTGARVCRPRVRALWHRAQPCSVARMLRAGAAQLQHDGLVAAATTPPRCLEPWWRGVVAALCVKALTVLAECDAAHDEAFVAHTGGALDTNARVHRQLCDAFAQSGGADTAATTLTSATVTAKTTTARSVVGGSRHARRARDVATATATGASAATITTTAVQRKKAAATAATVVVGSAASTPHRTATAAMRSADDDDGRRTRRRRRRVGKATTRTHHTDK